MNNFANNRFFAPNGGMAEDDDRCMLDRSKICDNCFRCLESGARAYATIRIDGVYLDGDAPLEAAFDAGVQMDERHVHIRVHPMTIRGYTGRRRIEYN